MLPERVEKLLRGYKNCIGRCGYLRKAIAESEADIALWRSRLAEDLVGSSGNAGLDGMPRGTGVGNPTQRMALMLATGYEPEDLKDAEAQLQILRIELRQKEMEREFVDAWLEGLSTKDHWLIEQIYFENLTYNETARAYADRFGIQISRDGIRRMRKTVVEKIAQVAQ